MPKHKANQDALAEALTRETPGKVFGLLTAAMASLMFLFAVSFTEASFQGTREHFPEPFSSQNVISAIDSAASGYGKFVDAVLVEPFKQDIALYKANIDWIVENDGDLAILRAVGLEELAAVEAFTVPAVQSAPNKPRVAGVKIKFKPKNSSSGLLDAMYGLVTAK